MRSKCQQLIGYRRNKEMRVFLTLSLVCGLATSAAAQFSSKNAVPRTAKAGDTATRKTADRTRTERVGKAADQATTDNDVADRLLAIIDADGDGVVTKAEMNKAMAALHKVHKDAKGNIS